MCLPESIACGLQPAQSLLAADIRQSLPLQSSILMQRLSPSILTPRSSSRPSQQLPLLLRRPLPHLEVSSRPPQNSLLSLLEMLPHARRHLSALSQPAAPQWACAMQVSVMLVSMLRMSVLVTATVPTWLNSSKYQPENVQLQAQRLSMKAIADIARVVRKSKKW